MKLSWRLEKHMLVCDIVLGISHTGMQWVFKRINEESAYFL